MIANRYRLRGTRSSHSDRAERKRGRTHRHRVHPAAAESDELRRVQSIVEKSDDTCDRAAHGRHKSDVERAGRQGLQVLADAIIALRVVTTSGDTGND